MTESLAITRSWNAAVAIAVEPSPSQAASADPLTRLSAAEREALSRAVGEALVWWINGLAQNGEEGSTGKTLAKSGLDAR